MAEVCLAADLGSLMGIVYTCKVGRALTVSLSKLGRNPWAINTRAATAKGIEVSANKEDEESIM